MPAASSSRRSWQGMGSRSSSCYQNKSYCKLFAAELLSVTVYPTTPPCFSRRLSRSSISRAEILGIVVSVDRAPKFLKFLLDDGTACVPCILWRNSLSLRPPSEEYPTPERTPHAPLVQLGQQLRVRGRISFYRGHLQITVRDVLLETDPNMDTFHRLDCLTIARHWLPF